MPKGHSILARDAAEAWPSPTSALTAVVVGSSVGIGGGTRPICSARPQERRSRASSEQTTSCLVAFGVLYPLRPKNHV
jgi:hypothetical protein